MTDDRYAPKLGKLRIAERAPVISQFVIWDTGPGITRRRGRRPAALAGARWAREQTAPTVAPVRKGDGQ